MGSCVCGENEFSLSIFPTNICTNSRCSSRKLLSSIVYLECGSKHFHLSKEFSLRAEVAVDAVSCFYLCAINWQRTGLNFGCSYRRPYISPCEYPFECQKLRLKWIIESESESESEYDTTSESDVRLNLHRLGREGAEQHDIISHFLRCINMHEFTMISGDSMRSKISESLSMRTALGMW